MLTITTAHYLVLAAILFSLSVAGIFINRKNVILLLMCIELMLLAVNFNFIAFSRMLNDTLGQVFVFFILTSVGPIRTTRRSIDGPSSAVCRSRSGS